ncbi:MAG: META domain-containing protein [Burkholderiales bacterium]
MLRGEIAVCAGLVLALPAVSVKAADPRYFALTPEVTRALVMRAEPATSGRRVGEVPAGANGLENKGCRGASDVAWDHLSRGIREAMARERWCRVRYDGREGWVAARFLREGSAPTAAAGRTTLAATPGSPGAGIAPGDGKLIGIEWRLAQVGGIETRSSVAWIRFRDNGDIEGHTGCNRLRATFVAGTTALRIGPLTSTRMACTDDAASAQENLLLGALEATEAHQVANGALRLFDAGGAVRAVLRPAR